MGASVLLQRVQLGLLPVLLALLLAAVCHPGSALAQTAQRAGVLADGDAVVTGFAGVRTPAQVAPGADPAAKTYIDMLGTSARIVDLQGPGAPPQAQLWRAPKPFGVTAEQVGQVFAVALDNALPPNIYLAATSAYGLPIVAADKDGDGKPDRIKQGASGARFMPGLFGPATMNGGPGSIWRIDGRTGEARLFANVRLNGEANPGPALGGLAFDPVSSSLFVADRATGMIHRFGLNGRDLGRFDHGIQGRTAAKLPPVAHDPDKRLNIQSANFKTENPATWGYAPRPRLVFGLAVREGRLYYAVADGLQVWSVSLTREGSFGKDARVELAVPPSFGATEIAKITFDDQGRMLLAGRGAPTGAFDFAELAQEGIGRVLRYQRRIPPGPPGAIWQPEPDEYAIGFASQLRNGNGGVAVGYRYDAAGLIDRARCDGFVWSTGEQLRVSPDQATAAQLAQSGPALVNGLQGNDADLVAPANVPPLQTYFIDYDDRFVDPAARGHLGDIAIRRLCGRTGLPLPQGYRQWERFRLPGLPPPPPILTFCPLPGPTGCICVPGGDCSCPPGTQKQAGFQCCPLWSTPGPNGQCTTLCPDLEKNPANGELCYMGFAPIGPNDKLQGPQDLGKLTCLDGSKPVADQQGKFQCPPLKWPSCPAGLESDGAGGCKVTAKLDACNVGNHSGVILQPGLNGLCQPLCPAGSWGFATTQCCPAGTVPGPDGTCSPPPPLVCPLGQVTSTGFCCPVGTSPKPNGTCESQLCPPGAKKLPTGCCLEDKITSSGKCCPMGSSPQSNGECLPPAKTCPPGQINPLTGACLPPSLCPANWLQKQNGMCCPPPGVVAAGSSALCKCPPGQNFDGQKCTTDAAPTPLPGGSGIPILKPAGCFAGFVQLPSGQCCQRGQVTADDRCCPAGQKPDANGRECVAAGPPASGFTPGTSVLPPLVPRPLPEWRPPQKEFVPIPQDRPKVVRPKPGIVAPVPPPNKKWIELPPPKDKKIVRPPPPTKKQIVVPPKLKVLPPPAKSLKRIVPPKRDGAAKDEE